MTQQNRDVAMDNDTQALFWFGILAGPTFLIPLALAKWNELSAWLLKHDVLVPARDALITLPGDAVGGLDLARVAIACCAVLLLGVMCRQALRKKLKGADS